ncbi:uncharacterized protein EAE97_005942 [Botrytis byssoidea]|uniref:Uncharacterized protein n=1 Tax=Botrytis byssoidea TaxID=139641 RepID=A0A9P5IJS2_9HELO|nr:uncharacterized protein EAE97_005942 [Botrytis byssoidea]KAF7943872.1 hypothetical protein EAE97_005942 [Botrytis byssoidea]
MSQVSPTQRVQNNHIEAFEIDFDQYIRERREDCRSWNQIITGTLSNRIDQCKIAIEKLDKEIEFCDERASSIELDRVSTPDYQGWLLESYEQLLNVLYALKAWFRQYQDDYEALHHALSNRDAVTAEEIQRDLEEPSEYGEPIEEDQFELEGDSEMEDDTDDGSESGFEDDPKRS